MNNSIFNLNKCHLGIDYGDCKTGIAISRSMIIASCYTTIFENDLRKLCVRIKNIAESEDVFLIVVGYPLGSEGEKNKRCKKVDKFIKMLSEETQLKVVRQDERFSTQLAIDNLRQIGIKGKKIKQKEDSEAARIILEEYLEHIKTNN